MSKRVPTTLEQRFWGKVDISGGPTACWNWKASLDPGGYGAFGVGGKKVNAHRFAFILENGYTPSGLVCHSCDNRACCNPRHLSEGTYKSNMRECVERGRHPRLSTRQKLTPRQVAEIRQLKDSGLSQRAIGRQYGVDHMQVCRLWKGEQWKTRNQSS